MDKRVVVISNIVDSTIRDYQKDVEYVLFKTLDELGTYIEMHPIRADSLYFTRDVIPQVNTSLNYLLNCLENPFVRIDRVVYITEENSEELVSIEYLIETKNLKWEVIKGHLTRAYIYDAINGILNDDEAFIKRKAVYRVPRESYLKSQIRNEKELDNKYISDEEELQDVESIEEPFEEIPEILVNSLIYHIAGIDSAERTAFILLASQYLALSGKVVIVEKDIKYHRLYEYITKSGVNAEIIDISDLIEDIDKTLVRVKKSPKQLVCFCSIKRIEYSYSFIFNILYNNLCGLVQYFISEEDISEIVSDDTIVVESADMLGILETCTEIDVPSYSKLKFVAVNMNSLNQIKIHNSLQIKEIMADLLSCETQTFLVNINTLNIGDTYDLSEMLRKE